MVQFVQHDKTPGSDRDAGAASAPGSATGSVLDSALESVIDYAATARRLGWDDLPAEVRARVAGWAGGRVGSVQLAGGGFTHGFAALVDGPRPLFAKAIALDDPHIAPAYAREVEVLAALPAGAPVPALLEQAVVAGWQVLATVPVAGRMPGAPWTLADARAVHDSCRTSNAVLEAAGPAVLPVAGTMAGGWAAFLAGLGSGDGAGPWVNPGKVGRCWDPAGDPPSCPGGSAAGTGSPWRGGSWRPPSGPRRPWPGRRR